MKNKKKELDVDFIGGEGHLTKEEEKSISKFIKKSKLKRAKKSFRTSRTSSRKRVTA